MPDEKKKSLQFSNFQRQLPCCSIFSGRLPVHANQNNHEVNVQGGGIPLNMTTLPELLKRRNYATHQLGVSDKTCDNFLILSDTSPWPACSLLTTRNGTWAAVHGTAFPSRGALTLLLAILAAPRTTTPKSLINCPISVRVDSLPAACWTLPRSSPECFPSPPFFSHNISPFFSPRAKQRAGCGPQRYILLILHVQRRSPTSDPQS